MTKPSLDQFLSQGLRQSLVLWFASHYSLSSTLHAKLQAIASWVSLLMLLGGGLVGFSTMVGVMSMGNKGHVNLLLFLALFVVVPSLLASLSISGLMRRSGGLFTSIFSPWLEQKFSKLSKTQSNLRDHALIIHWLHWQSHLFSLAYLAIGLLVFAVMVTLQDYQFGWSTTVKGAEPVFERSLIWLTAAFQQLVNVDIGPLIRASQLQPGSSVLFDTGDWWKLLSLMIVCYSLGLRLIAMVIARFRYQRRLLAAGRQTLLAHKGGTSAPEVAHDRPDVGSDQYPVAKMTALELSENTCVAWQVSMPKFTSISLGLHSWEEDIETLKANEKRLLLSTVCFLLQPITVPTAELADIMHLLSSQYRVTQITLVVVANESKVHPRNRLSWQVFAQRHQVNLALLEEVE